MRISTYSQLIPEYPGYITHEHTDKIDHLEEMENWELDNNQLMIKNCTICDGTDDTIINIQIQEVDFHNSSQEYIMFLIETLSCTTFDSEYEIPHGQNGQISLKVIN